MSGPRRTWESVASVFSRALQAGADRPSIGHVRWNIAGRCEAPQTVILSAAPSEGLRDTRRSARGRYVHLVPGLTKCTLTVELETRCRRCGWCLKKRAAKWRLAARSELDAATGRSWFGTLTFRPEERFLIDCRAAGSATRKGEDWRKLAPAERFAYLANAAGALVTKWIKRVRKESAAPLRYLVVVEAHKDGFPHYHLLLHETDAGRPIRKELLQRQWSHGFSNWKLVKDTATAGYVTKYLSKSLMARVRASVRYGKTRALPIVEKRVDPRPPYPLSLVAGLDARLLGDAEGTGLWAEGTPAHRTGTVNERTAVPLHGARAGP